MGDVTRADQLRTQAVQACLGAMAGISIQVAEHRPATRLTANNVIEQESSWTERPTSTSPAERARYTTTVTVNVERRVIDE